MLVPADFVAAFYHVAVTVIIIPLHPVCFMLILRDVRALAPEYNGTMHVMGREIRRELKIITAQAVVVEHIRKVIPAGFAKPMNAVCPYEKHR